MLRRRSTVAVAALAAFIAAIFVATSASFTAGCGACRCAAGGAFLTVPESRALHLAGVVANGPMCEATVNCSRIPSNTGFSLQCNIDSSREGTCHVEAAFADGTPSFAYDVMFHYVDGCCAGIHPDSASVRVEVPAVAAGDAGEGDARVLFDAAGD